MMKHTINYSRTDNVISYLTIVCLLLACILLPQEMQHVQRKRNIPDIYLFILKVKEKGACKSIFVLL